MKRITSIVAGSLFAVLIIGGTFAARVQAQDEPGVTFKVPFAFSADGQNIPAGTYQLNLVSNQFEMSIRNVQTGDVRFLSVHPEQQLTVASRGLLVFHGCGERKDLAEFHIPGTSIYSATIVPRGAKNMESKSCPTPGTLTVASR